MKRSDLKIGDRVVFEVPMSNGKRGAKKRTWYTQLEGVVEHIGEINAFDNAGIASEGSCDVVVQEGTVTKRMHTWITKCWPAFVKRAPNT